MECPRNLPKQYTIEQLKATCVQCNRRSISASRGTCNYCLVDNKKAQCNSCAQHKILTNGVCFNCQLDDQIE